MNRWLDGHCTPSPVKGVLNMNCINPCKVNSTGYRRVHTRDSVRGQNDKPLHVALQHHQQVGSLPPPLFHGVTVQSDEISYIQYFSQPPVQEYNIHVC